MALFHREKREDLASRLERRGTRLSQMAAEKGTETSRKVADVVRRASDNVQSLDLDTYRGRARDAVDTARVHAEDSAENARDTIRTHPLTSVAIAAGLGVLAGTAVALLSRQREREYKY